MKMYAKLYHFYRTAFVRTIRLLVFSLLLFLIIYQVSNNYVSSGAQFLFNVFLMVEIFFHYKISRALPSVSVDQNKGDDIFESFTLQALAGFISFPKSTTIIKKLLSTPQVQTLLQKANIAKTDMTFPDVDKNELAQKAYGITKSYKGTFVTTIDVVLAYLFLTESETKLFFKKKLKNEDIETIMYWLRREFAQEEKPHKTRVKFEGSGIGEALVDGWTYETKKYTDNFTYYALREEPLIGGHEKEFRSMLEGLVRLENNNVLLVGDIGAGKENLVRALAYHSFSGKLGASLSHRRVYQLLVGPLTAGINNRSDLEIRLQSIISEISHTDDVILYIPDFQNVLGGTSYNIDISGALLPYLKSGSMPIVATMTTGTYKTFMERNPLKEAFSTISLTEPENEIAIQMVLAVAKNIEKKYRVILSFLAIKNAVEYADQFLQDTVLPGSAVSLLETVANTVSLNSSVPYFENTRLKMVVDDQVVKQVESATGIAIGAPSRFEADLLLHLEEILHKRVIGQHEAIIAIAEAMRRIRSGMKDKDKPISFLFLGPTGVGKTETAKALGEIYFGGEKKMIRLDMSEYTDDTGLKRLLGATPGEGDERGELTDKVHDNPASLILLDEFEKAHPEVHNLFLQVLDDGRLTDNKGVTVSFSNAIIIATSNGGSEFIRQEVEKGAIIDKTFHQKLLDYLQTKAIFKPELLNRFDDVITFRPLGTAEVAQVIKLMLADLQKSLAESDITLTVDPAVVTKIEREGFDREFGARPLRRYIQDNIEDMIAQKKLTGELIRGNNAAFSVDTSGNLVLKVS
jgi:ATP-dependent Clp protease ATP-binding subunit ClpC